MESYTLHWIWPVLWKAHDIHSPSYMATAVMMLSPTYADIFHWGRIVPIINPMRPRRARANPRICRPEFAIALSSFFSQGADVNLLWRYQSQTIRDFAGSTKVCLLFPSHEVVPLTASVDFLPVNQLSVVNESLKSRTHLLPSPLLEWGGDSGDELFRRFPAQVGGDAHVVSTREAQLHAPEVSLRHCFRETTCVVLCHVCFWSL